MQQIDTAGVLLTAVSAFGGGNVAMTAIDRDNRAEQTVPCPTRGRHFSNPPPARYIVRNPTTHERRYYDRSSVRRPRKET